MTKKVKISIFEVVGSPLCVASSDGHKVYNRLASALQANNAVTLSFRNVTHLTTAFLNVAIGQLYGKFEEQTMQQLLEVEDIENDDLERLKQVVDTAKQYFKDPDKFDQAIREAREER